MSGVADVGASSLSALKSGHWGGRSAGGGTPVPSPAPAGVGGVALARTGEGVAPGRAAASPAPHRRGPRAAVGPRVPPSQPPLC